MLNPGSRSTSVPVPSGWILYDRECGICRRWVPFWEPTLKERGFAIAPLQASWVAAKLQIEATELLSDVRLLLADGTLIEGADVYRYAMRRIWWAFPFYLVASMPLFRSVFDWAYRTFAGHRHRISALCSMPNQHAAPDDKDVS